MFLQVGPLRLWSTFHLFILKVSVGNMQDQNNDQYLAGVELCFEDVFTVMKERLSGT